MSGKRKSKHSIFYYSSLTRQVLSAIAAVGFALSPLAISLGADAPIQKVDGTGYLANGNKADIYADAVLSSKDTSVALNTFKTFNVDAGKIANLHFKKAGDANYVNNLVNVVGDKININGVVNAVKDNKVGGNLYFLSSNGIAVGPTGVVNAGSVTMMTPTNKFFVEAGMAKWTDSKTEHAVNDTINLLVPGSGDASITALEQGFLIAHWGNIQKLNIPINKTGTISVEGQINTVDGINLLAGKEINIKPNAKLISKDSLDFSSLVNISDKDGVVTVAADIPNSSNLTATKTGSGDIVLAVAADTVNDSDDTFADFAKNAEGYNTVKTSLTVGKGATIEAAGDVSLTTVSSVGSGQAGFFGTDLTGSNASDLIGTMAKTVSEINIDGTVTGNKVNITADASNIYVNGSLSNFSSYTGDMIKSFIPLDSDLDYVVMANQALVTIGENAKITARDTTKDSYTEIPGYSIGNIQLIEDGQERNYALNIKANAYLEAGAGSAAAATKLSQKATSSAENDPGQLVPNAGVTYLEANNEANVVVKGQVESAGDTNINATASMNAEASAAADAPTRTTEDEVNNFLNLAAVIADLKNTATVSVGGAGHTVNVNGADLNIEANSDGQSYATSAVVGAGETTLANTAINVTDVATKADITIDGTINAKNLDIHADNTVSNNFTANNSVGLSKMGAKMASLRSSGGGGILGHSKDKAGKAPSGLEKLGEFLSAGASIGVINESNASNVTVTKQAMLTATDDLNVNADTSLSGSYINVSGVTNNYKKNSKTMAIVSAAVLASDLDNSSTVVVEGGDTAKHAQLKGANVNVKANSEFLYDRPATMWGDFQQLCLDIQSAYQGDKAVLDAVEKLLGVSQEEGMAYMADSTTGKAVEFFANVENLYNTINVSTIQANLDGYTALASIPSALMTFLDGANYANFYVSSSTGGKTGGGMTGGTSAKLALAGAVNASTLNNNAQVVIGKNAVLTADKTVDVNATATQHDVTFNGKVKLFPKTSNVGGADTAVGGNVGIYETNVNSLVVVGEGASLTGRAVDVGTNNDVLHIVSTFGGGAAGDTGVTGMVSKMTGTSDSIVAIDDEAVLKATAAAVDAADFAVADTATDDEKAQAKAALEKAIAENGAVTVAANNKTNIQNIVVDKTNAASTAVGAAVGLVDYSINNIAAIADTDMVTTTDAGTGKVTINPVARTSTEVSNLNTLLTSQLNRPAGSTNYVLDNYAELQAIEYNIRYLNSLSQDDVTRVDKAYQEATDASVKARLLAEEEQIKQQLSQKNLLLTRLENQKKEMQARDKANAATLLTETNAAITELDASIKEINDKIDALDKNASDYETQKAAYEEERSPYDIQKADYQAKQEYLTTLQSDTSVTAATAETAVAGPDLTAHLGSTDTTVTGKVTAGDVVIKADTTGLIDNISVAGVTSAKKKQQSGIGLKLPVAAAGSASVNTVTGNSAALVEGTTIDLVTTDSTVDTKTVSVSADDDFMTGAYSGAAAVKKSGAQGGGSGFGATLAGTVAYNDSATGVIAQIKDAAINNAAAIDNTATKEGALISAGLALGKQSGGSSGGGVSGTASGSYNKSNNTVHAVLNNASINNSENAGNASTALNNIAYDKDIQVAGGITAQYAQANLAVGVAGSYLDVTNDIQAQIIGGSLSHMDTVKDWAATRLIQVGAAISAGVVKGQSANGVEGAAAVNTLTNTVDASIIGSTIGATQLEAKAFDGKITADEGDNVHKATLVNDGFDVAGTDALEDVNGPTTGGTDVSVDDSTLGSNQGTTSKQAYKSKTFTANENTGNLIVTGAAGLALNLATQGTITAGGAVVYNDINNSFTSAIKGGSSVTATGTDGVTVKSDSDTLMIGVAAGVAASKGQSGLAAAGSASAQKLNNTTTATVENSTLTTDKANITAKSTSRMINVAGQVSATKGNVAAGLTTAINLLDNTTGAYVKGSTLQANNGANGLDMTVSADNQSKNYAIAAGVSASANQTGGALQGSVALNRGANNTEALVEKYEEKDKNGKVTLSKDSYITNAAKASVASTDSTTMKAISGGITASTGNAAIGGAAAYNEITGQTNRAAINNTAITTLQNAAVETKATDTSNLLTVAAGIALTTGQTGGAAQGSVAIADTTKTTKAEMDSTSINKGGSKTGVTALVNATSDNTIISSADVLAGSTANVAAGAGVAVNKSHNDTTATVTGGTYKLQDLTIKADSTAKITDIGVGIAATTGQGGSLAGNVAVNNIENNTEALLQSSADVEASGDVGVLALSNEHIKNYTGALSATLGNGYVAGGLSVAVNNISGTTKALVDTSTVTATGAGNGIGITEYGTDSDKKLTSTAKTVHGLVVDADAQHELDNVVVTAGTAVTSNVGVAVAGTVTVNKLAGATLSQINKTDVNAGGTAAASNVNVLANDNTEIDSHVGSAAVGIGVNGAGAAGEASDTNILSRSVKAQVLGDTAKDTTGVVKKNQVNANNLTVNAFGRQDVLTNAIGVAVAAGIYGSGGVSGTISVTKNTAETIAEVDNINSTNDGLTIHADHHNKLQLFGNSAAASGAMGSGSLGLGIGVVNDESNTQAKLTNSTITHIQDATAVDSVTAANDTDLLSEVSDGSVAVSIGGAASGSITVTNMDNLVETTVDNSTIGSKDKKAASFKAAANNTLTSKFATAAGAAGLGAAAVGIGVSTVDTSVVTNVDNSTVYAGKQDILADEQRTLTQYGAAAEASGIGLATNVMVTNVGSAVDKKLSYTGKGKDDADESLVDLDLGTYVGDGSDTNKAVSQQDGLLSDQNTAGALGSKDSSASATNSVSGLYTDSSASSSDSTMWTDMETNLNTGSTSSGLTSASVKAGATVGLGGDAAAQGVKVNVDNSHLLGTDVLIKTNADTAANLDVYQGSFSLAQASISVGVVDVERNSAINVVGSEVQGDTINLQALQGGTSTQHVYQGAIGGINANIAYGRVGTHGTNDINITTNSVLNGQKTVNIKADDTTAANVRVIGASAGAVNGGALISDASNDSTTTVTVDSSTVKVGTEDGKTDGTSVTITAAKNNTIKSEVYAGVLGAASGYGMVAVSHDAGGSSVKVNNNTFTASDVTIAAENNPQVQAILGQGSLNAFEGIGASVATATADGSATASSTGNTYLVDKLNIGTEAGAGNGGYTAESKVVGINGAGVAALQANVATSNVSMNLDTTVSGDTYQTGETQEVISTTYDQDGNVQKTSVTKKTGKTALTVSAENGTKTKADAFGVTVGAVAASGTNIAKTKNTTKSTVNVTGTDAYLSSLTITGSGAGDNTADAKGYGGGLVSLSPVAARVENTTSADTTVNVAGTFTVTGDILVQALQSDKSNLCADTVNATVAGYSGAQTKNNMGGTTAINLNSANLTTDGSLQVNALNTITVNDGDDYKQALKGSGYGGIVGAGATLDNTVTKTAQVNINGTSQLSSAKDQYLGAKSKGNVIFAGVIKAAGAATVAKIDVDNKITVNNNVNLNNTSSVKTTAADGNLTLASSDDLNMTVSGVSDIRAAVGGNASNVTNTYNRNDQVNLNGGTLTSKQDINLYAGKDVTGNVSRLELTTEAEAYNHSGAAFKANPDLDNSIVQNNQIKIAHGVSASSVANINVFADSGVEKIRETNIKYTWLHSEGSSDFTSSNMGQKSSSVSSNNFVTVDGTLTAGSQNKQNIIIGGDKNQVVVLDQATLDAVHKVAGQEGYVGKDGLIINLTDGQGDALNSITKDDFIVGSFNYGAELYQRYKDLQELVSGYSDNKSSAAYLGYVAEMTRIKDKMQTMGLYTADGLVIGEVNVDYISIPDLVASGGNINVNTDNFSGSGSLKAKGSPEINVINNTNLYMKVNDITVGDAGGQVIYNDNALSTTGTSLSLGDQIAAANIDHSKKISDVTVESGQYGKVNIEGNYGTGVIKAMVPTLIANPDGTYTTDTKNMTEYDMSPLADIEINGHIDSLKGEVSITSLNDNIIIQGKTANTSAGIDAGKISLTAVKGSVSQGYHDGITNVGGSVQDQYSGLYNSAKTNLDNQYGFDYKSDVVDVRADNTAVSSPGGNTIVGDNIYINASDININGMLQSGFAEYVAEINGSDSYTYKNTDTDKIGVTKTVTERLEQLKTDWEKSGSKILSDATITTGKAYEVVVGHIDSSDSTIYHMPVYYNPYTDKLVVPNVDANGGKVYLTGRISSTGSGSIKVLDGAYNIKVTSDLSNDVQLGKLVVNDAHGLISITDVNANKVTEIRRDGTTYKNLDGTVTGTGAALTAYTPQEGLRYNWTTGQSSSTKKTFENTVEKGLWGKGKVKKDFTDLTDEELQQLDNVLTPNSSDDTPIQVDKPNGEYIGTISGLDNTQNAADFLVIYNNYLVSNVITKPREIKDWKTGLFNCHHWALYRWTETTGTIQTYMASVKADKSVALSFFGTDASQASVSVQAQGNINATGNIGNKEIYQTTDTAGITHNNLKGGLTMLSTGGNILQTGGSIYGSKVNLNAKGDINLIDITAGDLVTVSAVNTGVLKSGLRMLGAVPSTNDNQDINLNVHSAYGAKGDVSVGAVGSSSTGTVTITADGNLIQANDADVITGQRINLISQNGTIGQTGKALKVYAGQTPAATDTLTASLNATAESDINLEQTSGDMRVGSINSAHGDVTLTTSGSIIDALPYADKIDRGDTEQLIQKWKDLNLIKGYGTGGEDGWTVDSLLYAIQDSVINPTSHVDTSTKAPNIVGKNITLNVGNSAGLNSTTTTTIDLTTLGDADHLNELKNLAGADASTVKWDSAAKKAYINEKLAIGIESKGGQLKVNSSGTAGNVYIQGRLDSTDTAAANHKDLALAGIQTEGNVIVESLGNITNAHDDSAACISGQDLYMTSSGAIGTAEKAMTTAMKGAVTATAVQDIYLNQISNDSLQLKALSSGKDIIIQAVGDITGYTDPAAVAGEAVGYLRTENDGTISLTSKTGSVGTDTAAVRIFNSSDDPADEDDKTTNTVTVNAAAGSVNLQGISTEIKADAAPQGTLYLKDVTAKNGINVTDNGSIKAVGAINNTASGSLNLAAVQDVTVGAQGSLTNAGTGLSLTAGQVDAADAAKNIVGKIVLRGDVTNAHGTAVLNSATGLVAQSYNNDDSTAINAKVVAADLQVSAATGIDLGNKANELQKVNLTDVANNITLGNGGSVDLDVILNHAVTGGIDIHNYKAGAVNDVIVNGTVQADKNINVLNDEGAVTFTSNDVWASAESVLIHAAGDVVNNRNIQVTGVDKNITLISDTGSIDNNNSLSTDGGFVDMTATEGIDNSGVVNANKAVTLTAKDGNIINSASLSSQTDVVALNASKGSITNSASVQAAQAATFDAQDDISLTGATNTIQGTSVSATVTGVGAITSDAALKATSGDVNLKTPNGNIAAHNTITAAQNVLAQTDKGNVTLDAAVEGTGGNVTTTTKAGNVQTLSTVTAGNNVTAGSDAGNVYMQMAVTAGTGTIEGTAVNGSVTTDGLLKSGLDTHLKAVDNGTVDNPLAGNIAVHNKIQSGRLTNLESIQGNITVDDDVTAGDAVQAATTNGNITFASKDGKVSGTSVNASVNGTGDIVSEAALEATKGDVSLTTPNGAITIHDTITAAKNVLAQTDKGDVTLDAAVEGTQGNVTATTKSGNISALGPVTAGQNVTANSDAGNVHLQGAVTAGTGSIEGVAMNGSVTTDGALKAGLDTHLKAVDNGETDDPLLGNITVNNSIDSGRITKLESINGNITFANTNSAISGTEVNAAVTGTGNITSAAVLKATQQDVSLTTQNGNITAHNTITAAKNVLAQTDKGDVTLTGAVEATQGNVTAATKSSGSITTDGPIKAGTDISMQAHDNITVNQSVAAGNGIALTTQIGNMATGSNGTLQANGADVALNVGSEGTLHTQSSITAANNVVAATDNGSITMDGPVTTQNGSITLQTKNETDPAKGAISLNGAITTLTSTDAGDVNILADHGNVSYTKDITIDGSGTLNIQVGTGNITAVRDQSQPDAAGPKLQSLNGSVDVFTQLGDVNLYEVFAEHKASVGSKNGDVTIHKIDGDIIMLQTKDMDNNLHVGETVAGSQIIISSNRIGLNDVQQRPGKDKLLLVDVDSADPSEPIDQLSMNFSKVNNGVEFSRLWLNNGDISVGVGKFYIDRLVVNNLVHFKDKDMTTSVYGVPPLHDQSTSIYWDNVAATNPRKDLSSWLNPEASGNWMNLFFGKDGRQQTSNGILLHLTHYNDVFNQRFTGEDYLAFLLDSRAKKMAEEQYNPGIAYYFRNDLYDLEIGGETLSKQGPKAEIKIVQ